MVPDKRMLQTKMALRATDLAESFRSTVGRLRVGPYAYTPDLTAPEGPSTGGGAQALQHLRLLPPRPNMPTLVVGHVNQRDGAAELRTFDHVEAICRERFQQGAPFEAAHYAEMLQSAQGFLSACGLRVALAGPPAQLGRRLVQSLAPPKGGAPLAAWLAVAIVIVGAALGGVIWFVMK
jgi:hypothetical protein